MRSCKPDLRTCVASSCRTTVSVQCFFASCPFFFSSFVCSKNSGVELAESDLFSCFFLFLEGEKIKTAGKKLSLFFSFLSFDNRNAVGYMAVGELTSSWSSFTY